MLLDEAPCHALHSHLSKFLRVIDHNLMFEGDSYLSCCQPRIVQMLKTNILEEEFGEPWFTASKDSELTYSVLDYRPLVFQRFVSDMLNIEDEETATESSAYRFNKLELSKTNSGLLKKCVDARVDLDQF